MRSTELYKPVYTTWIFLGFGRHHTRGLDMTRPEYVLEQDERAQIVRSSTLFAGLPEAHVEIAARSLRPRKLQAKQSLFLKGDKGDSAYIVLTGQINIIAQSVTGREVVLNTIASGEYFGELALLDGAPRAASAVASLDTHLAVITRVDFRSLLMQSPEFSITVLRNLAQRFRKINERLEAVHLHSLSQRLAQALLTLAEEDPKHSQPQAKIILGISQSELATRVGASRVSVNKHLQKWQTAGILSTMRERIVLHDRERLTHALQDLELRSF